MLLTELKADLNAYLATTPASVRTRTLADVIAFNKANANREMALFGQDLFEQAEKTKGLADPDYRKARETSLRLAGAEGIDKMLRDHDVDRAGRADHAGGLADRRGPWRPVSGRRRRQPRRRGRLSAPHRADGAW